ncbi:MAG: hypothetical protein JWQ21_1727 [Herminiimonas sp.]|nr:hypothetical protein [Herminiimonas sp.]
MSRDWCCQIANGIRVAVLIMPNAKKSEISGLFDDSLKIRLQAQPIEGKANDALIRYIAGLLDIPKSAIAIAHGATGKRKILEISARGLTVDAVKQALLPPTDN